MTQITIYRLTASTDDDTTTDHIVFNDATSADFKKPKRENAYCTQLVRMPTKGIADNQGVDNDLGDIQTVGNVEDMYVLDGYIEKRRGNNDDGNNAILQKLKIWDEESPVNADWPEGRFGLIDNGEHSKDVTPVGTGNVQQGLIWQDISYTSWLGKNREIIKIRLRRSKGDGT